MCFTQLIKIRTSAFRKLIINPSAYNDEVKYQFHSKALDKCNFKNVIRSSYWS